MYFIDLKLAHSMNASFDIRRASHALLLFDFCRSWLMPSTVLAARASASTPSMIQCSPFSGDNNRSHAHTDDHPQPIKQVIHPRADMRDALGS
jgi:hypothetical protein